MTLIVHYLMAKWRFTRLNRESLSHFQDNRAKRQIAFAIQRSPYYAALFAGWDGKNWCSLPVTDKQAMMADFGRFNTRGIPAEIALETALRAERERDFRPTIPGTHLTVGLSSGTSGHRGIFLVSPKERAAWAGTLLARALPKPVLRPGGWRIAFIHRSGSNLYESLKSRIVQFRYFDLMTPLPEIVASLNAFQPHILTAPPTLMGMLAEERRAGRLHITPERLLSVAEVLEPQDAATIAHVFDLPAVDQIYQSTEGLLAVSCPHHRLHWQADVVAAQFEEVDGLKVTPILTDLWRTTQPILRYRLGDILTLAQEERCRCGSSFSVIEQIEGRQDDVCQFPTIEDRKVLRPFFPDTLRRAVLLAHEGIADYRIVQEKPGALHIYLAVTREAHKKDSEVFALVRQSLEGTLARYGCRAEEIIMEAGIPQPTDPRAKRRRVIRLG